MENLNSKNKLNILNVYLLCLPWSAKCKPPSGWRNFGTIWYYIVALLKGHNVVLHNGAHSVKQHEGLLPQPQLP